MAEKILKRSLAIFDFDGTITKGDSFIDFLRYTVGPARFYFGCLCLTPYFLLYLFKIIPNWKAKEIAVTHFFKGHSVDKFQKSAMDYVDHGLPLIVKRSALEKINWHRQQGHSLVVVSASPENYLKIWCRHNDLALIATKLEEKDGKITGKLSTANCYGKEKVRRLKENYRLENFEFVYAYGDSEADKALLEIAQEFHFKSFK